MDERIDYSKIRMTASKAIRLKCLDCCGESVAEVSRCAIVKCPLYRYRSGKEQRDDLYPKTKRGLNNAGTFRARTARTGIVE